MDIYNTLILIGIIFSVVFFILAVVLFFAMDIRGAVMYFIKTRDNKMIKRSQPVSKTKSQAKSYTASYTSASSKIYEDKNEALSAVEDFATMLLEAAEATQLLPDLYE